MKTLEYFPHYYHKELRFTFLNVVIGQGSSIFELLSGENQTLLIWGNSLLVLDLGLHILDGVGTAPPRG